MIVRRFALLREKLVALTQRNFFALLVTIVVSLALLTVTNYFTIKILSSVRAYANGESQYSKGEKGAARHLISYVNTHDDSDWAKFKEELGVPIGDSLARVALTHNGDIDVIRQGFLAGRNHPDDIDNLIWLFRHFKNVSFMAQAIQAWKEADQAIEKEYRLGEEAHHRLTSGQWSSNDQRELIRRINDISSELTLKERTFSSVLGAAARDINHYLFVANIFFTLLILGCALGYAASMIGRILKSQTELELKNLDLTNTNRELDNFVYSASHDIRAPLMSLKGLIEIAQIEDDPEQLKEYLKLMQLSLEKQDHFINDIINFSRNKRVSLQMQEVSLVEVIDNALNQHRFMKGADRIDVHREYSLDKVFSDPLRLSILFNNLVSNAIKYSDAAKDCCFLKVKTYPTEDHNIISIEDNGVGIRPEDQKKIFDMFFVTQNNNKGTGLGLYIVKEAVQKLGGSIAVESEKNVGTKFIIQIPKRQVVSLSTPG
ncbi:sensor histidine kinase [Chryseolinea lacunae]|uniref:histidine kinase n=1 Tax=Chryseolinea lacunae TaxID=2801331 RepID=A0ABS1KSI3_9BACT|nr:HAMP domain-containing sensor histidine kinase [Chryseolinea lacunae]MBL0742182.1 HAMP domain-containing histidine kinase [Chryseolinea lacunae]